MIALRSWSKACVYVRQNFTTLQRLGNEQLQELSTVPHPTIFPSEHRVCAVWSCFLRHQCGATLLFKKAAENPIKQDTLAHMLLPLERMREQTTYAAY